jgi:hypothetical protein
MNNMSTVPHAHVLATIDKRDSKPPKFHKILSACSMSQNGQLVIEKPLASPSTHEI